MLPESGIVLAPLAGGPSTPELAAAVSNAGGLGFLGGAYLAPEQLREQLALARRLTSGPLGVNLFVLRDRPVDQAAITAYAKELEPEARRLGVQLGEPHFDDDAFDAKLEIALDAGVEVVSFTFGCPAASVIARVRRSGVAVWLTVTSSEEARAASTGGSDALVVQGPEAEGHRGTWEDRDDGDVPLLELVEAIAAQESVPLIAAGGIADRRGCARSTRRRRNRRPGRHRLFALPRGGDRGRASACGRRRPGDRSDARIHRPPRTRACQCVHARA